MTFIRIRFIAADSFVSRAIRWITNSLFSHVEFGTPEGSWIGAHDKGGIQERPANYCTPVREYVYEIPCSDSQQKALLAWARSQIGTEYNFLDILGLMLRRRKLTTPNRYICSQFCTDGLLRIFGPYKVLNVLREFDYLVTPEMLHLSPILTGRMVKKYG